MIVDLTNIYHFTLLTSTVFPLNMISALALRFLETRFHILCAKIQHCIDWWIFILSLYFLSLTLSLIRPMAVAAFLWQSHVCACVCCFFSGFITLPKLAYWSRQLWKPFRRKQEQIMLGFCRAFHKAGFYSNNILFNSHCTKIKHSSPTLHEGHPGISNVHPGERA